jgi:hypothetical protein
MASLTSNDLGLYPVDIFVLVGRNELGKGPTVEIAEGCRSRRSRHSAWDCRRPADEGCSRIVAVRARLGAGTLAVDLSYEHSRLAMPSSGDA